MGKCSDAILSYGQSSTSSSRTEGQTHPSSRYPHIDTSKNQIRLVEICPAAKFEDPIKLRFRTTNPSSPDRPQFTALSYCWNPTESGLSNNKSNRSVAQVENIPFLWIPLGENLQLAIRHWRGRKKVRTMWIDAICINQNDIKERNHQIQLMGQIYSSAQAVVIWLGPSDEASTYVMDVIRSGKSDWYLGKLVGCLHSFLERDWFRRVWIIQEITLARTDPVLCCGYDSVPWSMLYLFIRRLRERLQGREDTFCFADTTFLTSLDHINPEYSEHGDVVEFLGEHVEMLGDIRMSGSFASFPEQLHRMISLEAEASDPRDMVYGLLGFSRFTGPPLVPDYSKSTVEVFSEAMAALITEDFSFSFPRLSLQPGDITIQGLPSWVPDLTAQENKRDDPSSTEGLVPSREVIDNAIAKSGIAPIVSFSLDYRSLTTAGKYLGTIIRTLPVWNLWVLSFSSQADAHMAAQSRLKKFLRGFSYELTMSGVLAAILGSENPYVPPQSDHTMVSTLRKWIDGGRSLDFEWYFDRDPKVKALERALKYSSRNGRHVFITDTGLVGLAHYAPKGTVLVGLFGINFPFILQERGNEYYMINVAHVANHCLGHEFIKPSGSIRDWKDLREFGLREYVIV